MIDFKKGDYIWFAKADSAPMMEHICKVDMVSTVIEGKVIIGTKTAATLVKQMSATGISCAPVPYFGIANAEPDEMIYIDLDQFDFMGLVTNSETISKLEQAVSPLVDMTKISPDIPDNPMGLHLV